MTAGTVYILPMPLWGRVLTFCVASALCLLLLHAQAWAQQTPAQESTAASSAGRDKAARDLFNAGRTAFSEGLFEDAMASFKRAYELSQRPQLLFNVGMAADSARHDAEAIAAFEQYLREIPNAENREYVEARIAVLKKAAEGSGARATASGARPELAAEPGTLAAPAAATRPDRDDKRDKSAVASKWWFWSAIGAGVAAAAITGVVLSTRDSSSSELQKGDVGGVIQTLRVTP